MTKLENSFYERPDVLKIAQELLGKLLVTEIGGRRTSGRIVETEAYRGATDRASHAWNNRRTRRTEVMYGAGGVAYVYLCYGIHHLFNVVTNVKDVPHAVLVRGLEPVEGIDTMLWRCGKQKLDTTLTAGPGSLSKALGITTELTGESLSGNVLWIEDALRVPRKEIVAGTRVGVAYALDDAYLPYRFSVRGNPWVSKGKGL
ncbi:DNA-3-methyladenine glycosylase [Chitinophaga cymbidii]|uniref:Putative 3-methyladenine DNA glycosylase n=1 Tax=Chitinophaga cymbidii TaxID=1096750 RepID=A0A512RFZ0_9BACT|nr:DNA-3-methyladenine glycosylase [Chitinophaga cymbidii]GEP94629.1 putative 3-methyladenine DNA glycosylase [Chitinophaga cymbidii]